MSSEILELLWEEPSTLDPKMALKAEAFRKVFVAAFKSKSDRLPPGIAQKQVENVRAKAWNAFQNKLHENSLPDKIIVLVLPPLQRAVGGAADKDTKSSILSLSTEEGNLSIEENDCSLTVDGDEKGWKVSFRTVSQELTEKKVLFTVTENESLEKIVNQTQELTIIDRIWGFDFYLPESMDMVKSYTVEISHLSNEGIK
jgi:hypothetical protein